MRTLSSCRYRARQRRRLPCRLFAMTVALLLLSAPAFAACAWPSGVSNDTHVLSLLPNGNNTLDSIKSYAAGISATGLTGQLTYDSTGNTLLLCDGSAWQPVMADGGITVLTGDVTASGSGSVVATIASNAVTTAKIANGNVTNAKLANMAAHTIKGNNTAAAAAPSDLTVAQLQAMIGAGIPEGAIMAFDLTTCPDGWSEYTAARGRFLRGIDNGAGLDPDGTRAPGNTQADEFKSHTHKQTRVIGTVASGGYAYGLSTVQDGPATAAAGGAETRPKNVAVLFCRKD